MIEKKNKMKGYENKIYDLLKTVPKGKITTYKSLASYFNLKAYRAVGKIMNKNPYAPIVPCHRVILSSGEIGGFARGKEKKMEMLKSEGIEFLENGKIDLKKFEHKFNKSD
jgi:methylated-DNA-[protein]-cysteine S-methyltransferase